MTISYIPAKGDTLQEMKDNARKSDLYQFGDMKLVWVNEGDLYTGMMEKSND